MVSFFALTGFEFNLSSIATIRATMGHLSTSRTTTPEDCQRKLVEDPVKPKSQVDAAPAIQQFAGEAPRPTGSTFMVPNAFAGISAIVGSITMHKSILRIG
jgi:hypothetical protein